MKIHKPIGSKDRFLEMFQGVTKVKLNEAVIASDNTLVTKSTILTNAFNELINGAIKITNTNSQSDNNNDNVEITGTDDAGNQVTFRFNTTTSQGDQDGVLSVDSAQLIDFVFKNNTYNVQIGESDKLLQQFNAERGQEMIDVVSEYVQDDSGAPEDTELYEDAVNLIDKIPYKKSTEDMQTNAAYADQKPTNPDVRVQSDELQKFISEIQDYDSDDVQGNEPEFRMQDFDEPELEPEDMNEPDEVLTPEKERIIMQAYENLVARNSVRNPNYAPTTPEIMAEIDKIEGKVPTPKTRVYPKEAEPFLESSLVTNVDAGNVVAKGFDDLLSPETKNQVINVAIEILDMRLGVRKFQMPKEQYIKMIKDLAIMIYQRGASAMNEEDEKGDYPDQMGKTFKTKSKYPKKKKKIQTTVRIGEEFSIDPAQNRGRTDGENLVRQNIIGFGRRMDFNKLSNAYEQLLKLHGELRNTSEFQGVLSSLRDAIVKYFNLNNVPVGAEDVQNFFTTQANRLREEEEKLPEPAIEPDFDSMGMGQDDGMSLEPKGDEIEQIAQGKEAAGEEIEGGLADGKSPLEYDPEQILKGIKVELEHTDDPMKAVEIAMDHLEELPDYYDRLEKMEGDAENNGAGSTDPMNPSGCFDDRMLAKGDDSEMTDVLLGYEPKNVGDEVKEDEDVFGTLGDIFRPEPKPQPEPKPEEPQVQEEIGMEDYKGAMGDRYADAEGNEFAVSNKVKGGVSLKGQGGEKEVATGDLTLMKKLSESKEAKSLITEEQIKIARQTLSKSRVPTGMSKKDAVQILIKNNLK